VKDIIVLSKDKSLFELIFCELSPRGFSVGKESNRECSLLFADDASLNEITSIRYKDLVIISRTPEKISDARVLARPLSMPDLRAVANELLTDGSDGIRLDKKARCAISFGLRVPLSENEFLILAALIDARGKTVSKKALESAINSFADGELEVYICRLRRKLEKDGRRLIFTERGKGYKIM